MAGIDCNRLASGDIAQRYIGPAFAVVAINYVIRVAMIADDD